MILAAPRVGAQDWERIDLPLAVHVLAAQVASQALARRLHQPCPRAVLQVVCLVGGQTGNREVPN